MIKHIVLFQLKSFDSENLKAAKIEEIKKGLLALDDKIDALLSIEVGVNCNPNEQFDIALTTTFNNMEDLEIYAKHPDHLAVGKIIREVLEARSCVDFEY
ncbi:Dabb family protein [Carboxylicivirga mesophila]|uniref:Dabb family protein n=1 Tax=Carboxylicivirga mesophila TaxID=1166478 RepID=A0ABS5K9F5_9BACT|nr:Dabb family protein [Carboxylicivirga mesophila]MBS2211635.1 Dabb family protein [Carboxylicivirga mesophila]